MPPPLSAGLPPDQAGLLPHSLSRSRVSRRGGWPAAAPRAEYEAPRADSPVGCRDTPSLASAAFKPLQGTTVTRPRIHRRRPMAAPRVWPGALEVLGDEEDEPEQPEEGQRDRAGRGREPGVAEQLHVEHRVGPADLPEREPGQDHRRPGQAGQRRRRGPAVPGRLDHRPDQQPGARDRPRGASRGGRPGTSGTASRNVGGSHRVPGECRCVNAAPMNTPACNGITCRPIDAPRA